MLTKISVQHRSLPPSCAPEWGARLNGGWGNYSGRAVIATYFWPAPELVISSRDEGPAGIVALCVRLCGVQERPRSLGFGQALFGHGGDRGRICSGRVIVQSPVPSSDPSRRSRW